MVMDDVIGVAIVMDDVRGSSWAPEEPMVRSLARNVTFTLFLEIKCVRKSIILNGILSTSSIPDALPFLHFRERLFNQIVLID